MALPIKVSNTAFMTVVPTLEKLFLQYSSFDVPLARSKYPFLSRISRMSSAVRVFGYNE
jgi:hypothetical protein